MTEADPALTAKPAPRPARAPSLNQAAYDQIKRLILRLKLKPGEHINEAQLSETLNIGRNPVNRAMHRLSFEGLVQIMPRKGIVVQPLSLDDAIDLIEVRRLNEPYCAVLAAKRINASELAELGGIVGRAKQAVRQHDLETVIDLDREFHRVIATASRNKVMLDLLMQLHDRSQRFWALTVSDAAHLDEILTEHTNIIDAFEKRDAAAAELAMQVHIESFRSTMERTIRY